jgi:photosystem II stability/assembly factor-like uncharacterized protein
MKRWKPAQWLAGLVVSTGLVIQTSPTLGAIQSSKAAAPRPKLYLAVSFPSRMDGFMAVLRSDNSTYLVATTDGGRHWKSPSKTMPWPSAKSAPALPGSLDFVNADHGWVLRPGYQGCHTGSSCLAPSRLRPIYATRDGGHTWHREYAPPGVHMSQVQFISPSHGWMLGYPCRHRPLACATKPEALETTNGGATWRLARWSAAVFGLPAYSSPPARTVWGASLHFRSQRLGWIAASFDGPNGAGNRCETRLLLTTNGGVTWSRVLHRRGVQWCGVIPAFATPLKGWVVATPGTSECSMGGCSDALFRTRDGGRTWVKQRAARSGPFIAGGFPDGMQAPDANHVWMEFGAGAGPGGGGVATTSNGGRTWLRSLICYRDTASSKVALTGPSSAWLVGDVQLCPRGYSHGPVVKTANGGHTWHSISP